MSSAILSHAGHGPSLASNGEACFRLWAPAHALVHLALEGDASGRLARTIAMQRLPHGWHELQLSGCAPGMRYWFVLPDGRRVPDPASRYQPDGVHGASELVASGSRREQIARGETWRGRHWNEAVIYELHVGTFSAQGSFEGAIEKLDHLVALGITVLELMPIAAFPGRHNWGYDGVYPYACAASYGRPETLQRLIDEAHARGLMVFIDVVYNHFGPEGNYLALYAPQFFAQGRETPWGTSLDFDGPDSGPVRQFFIDSALRWIEEFHVDGLRLDAVHTIVHESEPQFLDSFAQRVRAAAAGRHVHLILEDLRNGTRLLARDVASAPLAYDAQWNDDLHHVLHALITGERGGYYADYADDPHKLGRALAEGFAFQGEYMPFRKAKRGEPSAHLPPTAFIGFLQDHDQIGNRARGERITQLAEPQAVRAALAAYLLLPQIPMLFMGEEWAAAEPFPFFCDFAGDLAAAVRAGRLAKCARHQGHAGAPDSMRMPEPSDPATFESAKLRWSALGEPEHARWLDWYRQILAVRRTRIVPLLAQLGGHGGRYSVLGGGAVSVEWGTGASARLLLNINLSARRMAKFPAAPANVIWREGRRTADALEPWSIEWVVPN